MRTVVRKYREVLTIKTFVRSHVDMQTTKNLDTRTNVLYVTKLLKHQELINRPVEKFCGDVYNSVKQQLYSDEELKHLMLLNRGIGIRQFCAEFSKSSDRRNRFSTVERLKGRVLDIIELTKEWDGLDLYSVLNDPAGLIKMRKDEWIINGCPPTASKHTGTKGFGSKTPGKPRSRVTVKKMKATYARYEQSEFKFDKFDRRTTQYVMVLPEFNWGPYKKRTRPEK